MSLSIDWSKLYSARNIVKSRFPSIWKIPLVKKEMAVIEKFLRPNLRILEVGAGDRRMGDAIKKTIPVSFVILLILIILYITTSII